MKKNTTRRALLTSALSLLLCVSMLIGTTFAWFTDNVSTVNNVIVSGNLDVELEYSTDMATWNEVKADTNIFKDALWEPGYTEVVYLRVTNAGNLAMKYTLGVKVANETPGKTRDVDVEFKLSDFIEYGVVENVTAAYEADTDDGRKAAKAAVATPVKLNTAFEKEYNLVGKTATATDSDTYALVVYMPESVTNEANHNGTNVPKINLGLFVNATQLAKESDSFNDQYDADAKYPVVVNTTADAQAKLDSAKPGDVIELAAGNYGVLTVKKFWTGDFQTTGIEPITIKGGAGVNVEAVDLNGMNFVTIDGLTFDSSKAVQVYAGGSASGDYGSVVDSANKESASRGANHITIKNCTFTGTPAVAIGKYCPINFMGNNPSSWTYNITISNCKFYTDVQNFIRMNNATARGSVVVEGNTFGGDAYTVNHHAINASANAADWTIKGNTFVNWNPVKCAFATGYLGNVGDVADIVITGNTFSNTRAPGDGDDGIIEIKTNSYDTTKYTLNFSGNTFKGALSGLNESTIKVTKP